MTSRYFVEQISTAKESLKAMRRQLAVAETNARRFLVTSFFQAHPQVLEIQITESDFPKLVLEKGQELSFYYSVLESLGRASVIPSDNFPKSLSQAMSLSRYQKKALLILFEEALPYLFPEIKKLKLNHEEVLKKEEFIVCPDKSLRKSSFSQNPLPV